MHIHSSFTFIAGNLRGLFW